MVGPRWRSGASKDNDVKHEDHRYRIGLASGTKDIQLMIPYVTRRVFTRRLVILLARPPCPLPSSPLPSQSPPSPLAIGRPLGFTSATPKWTAGYPSRTVNIFSFDEGRPGRASSTDPGWPDPAITTLPGHAHHREHPWGLFAGSLLLFSTLYVRALSSIRCCRLATRSSSSPSREALPPRLLSPSSSAVSRATH
jgi:hypothetical protein